MTGNAETKVLYDAVERETQRTTYPDDLPPLPDAPSARYFDKDFHQLEMEHVFHKSWLYAAHISELPESGSYKLFEQMGLSIIISRGEGDTVRAFRNVCRHRGAALVTEPTGKARRFVCPYHAWGYSAEGELKSVPEAHNFACLNKAEKPLLKVRCETWRGFIFINLDDDAEPLADFIKPYADQATSFPLEEMEVKRVLTAELDCNWKTSYDNFLEIYHVSTVHPQTLAPYLDSKSFVVTPLDYGHGRFTTRKRGAESMFDAADTASFDDKFRQLAVALPRFPNGFTALDPAGFNWMNFWPAGPGKMIVVSTLIGRTLPDEAEDKAYWDNFSEAQKAILAEDMGLFGSLQRAYEQGEQPTLLLSCQEQHIQWYNEHIDLKIGPDKIPAQLRMQRVMTDRTED